MEPKNLPRRKRKVGQKSYDLNFILPLFLKGKGFGEIADLLQAERDYNVTRALVYGDIRGVLAEWQAERKEMIDCQMDIDLKKIDRLEAVYWDSWEKSCQAKIKTVQKQRDMFVKDKPKKNKKDEKEKADDIVSRQSERHVTEVVGDKAWLEGVQWCIEQRAALLQYKKITPAGTEDTTPPVGELVFITRSRKNDSQYADAIEIPDTDNGDISQKLLQA